MRSSPQTVATDGNGFRLIARFSGESRFATGCHRLQPRGSIKAPSQVASGGDMVGASVFDVSLRGRRKIRYARFSSSARADQVAEPHV
jgi:hypothetical protein